jgi:hypothetical protein
MLRVVSFHVFTSTNQGPSRKFQAVFFSYTVIALFQRKNVTSCQFSRSHLHQSGVLGLVSRKFQAVDFLSYTYCSFKLLLVHPSKWRYKRCEALQHSIMIAGVSRSRKFQNHKKKHAEYACVHLLSLLKTPKLLGFLTKKEGVSVTLAAVQPSFA